MERYTHRPSDDLDTGWRLVVAAVVGWAVVSAGVRVLADPSDWTSWIDQVLVATWIVLVVVARARRRVTVDAIGVSETRALSRRSTPWRSLSVVRVDWDEPRLELVRHDGSSVVIADVLPERSDERRRLEAVLRRTAGKNGIGLAATPGRVEPALPAMGEPAG